MLFIGPLIAGLWCSLIAGKAYSLIAGCLRVLWQGYLLSYVFLPIYFTQAKGLR